MVDFNGNVAATNSREPMRVSRENAAIALLLAEEPQVSVQKHRSKVSCSIGCQLFIPELRRVNKYY